MHAKAIKINPDTHLPYLIIDNAYFLMNMCDGALDIKGASLILLFMYLLPVHYKQQDR